MPVHDLRPDRADAALPFPRFNGAIGQLLDATGARVELPVRFDTETGEVEFYDRTDGRFRLGPNGRVATVREFRPAPLRYVPLDPPTADQIQVAELRAAARRARDAAYNRNPFVITLGDEPCRSSSEAPAPV